MGESPARWDEILISSNSLSSTTHRSATTVGFLSPSLACGSTKPNPMHHETETLEPDAPDHPANSRHGLTALSHIYLEAGLPLDLAIQSAAADIALFGEELLCA